MYATLEKGADISAVDTSLIIGGPALLRTTSNMSDLFSLDGDLDFSDNADFCEVFTDLSHIMQVSLGFSFWVIRVLVHVLPL